LVSFPCADRKSSVTSAHSTFSTLGRDEMERKKGDLDEFADDGPFGQVKDLQALEERRKRIGEGGKRKEKDGEKGAWCRCLVM
jgi:hypothetical protein